MEKIHMSYTKANTYMKCHKAYWWKYEQNLVPRAPKKAPLVLGDIVHQLLHKYYTGALRGEHLANLHDLMIKGFPEHDPEALWDLAVEAGVLINGYIQQYEKDNVKVISSEIHLQAELPNCTLYGRVDALAYTEDKRLWRMEHKTASRDDSYYLGGLRSGLQGGLYHYLIEQNIKEKLSGTIYNMLIKTKVPKFPRMMVTVKQRHIERCLQTLDGVVQDIQNKNFYPSSECFSYNEECPFGKLCDSDSDQTREAFYQSYKENRGGKNPQSTEKGGEKA